MLDLLNIVMDDSQYHARRCVDMGNNLLTSRLNNQKSRYLAQKSSKDPSRILRIDSSSFLVPSETKADMFYVVDMDLRLCECYMGQLKGPCKHKSIVSTTQNIPCFYVVPTEMPVLMPFIPLELLTLTGLKVFLSNYLVLVNLNYSKMEMYKTAQLMKILM